MCHKQDSFVTLQHSCVFFTVFIYITYLIDVCVQHVFFSLCNFICTQLIRVLHTYLPCTIVLKNKASSISILMINLAGILSNKNCWLFANTSVHHRVMEGSVLLITITLVFCVVLFGFPLSRTVSCVQYCICLWVVPSVSSTIYLVTNCIQCYKSVKSNS